MNCYISGHSCSDLPKLRGCTSFARCTSNWDRALNEGIAMATTTGPPRNYDDIRAGIVELLEADRGCRWPKCQFDYDPLCTGTLNCVSQSRQRNIWRHGPPSSHREKGLAAIESPNMAQREVYTLKMQPLLAETASCIYSGRSLSDYHFVEANNSHARNESR
jgi:hypothetical protein